MVLICFKAQTFGLDLAIAVKRGQRESKFQLFRNLFAAFLELSLQKSLKRFF